eukprot:TRINITY_DN18003_c0_g2_i1.p1 TRINITY_DN18003_c0_g2~~TRINITY_DN18003_c0_g2_i1.p1  ORF type:complete len:598 (+),score=76.42 TRINITY_DN18003_c0_g2_i1:161-1795(+)
MVRAARWREIAAKKREDTTGMRDGVDYMAVTRVWSGEPEPYRAGIMRAIIAGDQVTEDRRLRHYKQGNGMCKLCGLEKEDHEHMWWRCEATADYRRLPAYRDVVAADRTNWPPCLARNGILPLGFVMRQGHGNAKCLRQLLGLYTEIILQRERLLKQREAEPATGVSVREPFPWGWDPEEPLETYDKLPDALPPQAWSKVAGVPAYFAVRDWWRQLKWPDDENNRKYHVSWLELAVDFEVFTGVDVVFSPGSKKKGQRALTARDKGTLMAAWMRTCEAIAGPGEYIHPGKKGGESKCKSLEPFIGQLQCGGLNRRPRLLCTQAVEAMLTRLKEQVREAASLTPRPSWTTMEVLVQEAGRDERRAVYEAAAAGHVVARAEPQPRSGVETLFFDGSLRRGKGTAKKRAGTGAGAVRKTASGVVVWTAQSRLAQGCTVNEAEYAGLLLCLDELIDHPPVGEVVVYGDSQLVADQVNTDTMCRSKKLRPLYVKARERIAALRAAGTRITLVHVGRKWNADADAAANAAVDKLEVGVTRHSRGEPESPV